MNEDELTLIVARFEAEEKKASRDDNEALWEKLNDLRHRVENIEDNRVFNHPLGQLLQNMADDIGRLTIFAETGELPE